MELGWVSNLDVYVWWCRTDLDGWMSMTWCSMHPTSDGDVHMHFVSVTLILNSHDKLVHAESHGYHTGFCANLLLESAGNH